MLGLKYFRIRKLEQQREAERQNQLIDESNQKQEAYRREQQILFEKPKKFVLTISARDYVEGVGKKLSDYEFIGVQGTLEGIFQDSERAGAEIVVEARPYNVIGYSIGTALIPKKK